MMIIRRFAILAAAVFLTGAAPFAPPQPGTRIAYRHAALIDGSGRPLQRDMTVITDGERIAAMLPDRQLTNGQLTGARQADLAGKFLIPGLIDSHQHIATPPNRRCAEARLRRDLYSGITATRIMADDLRSIAELDRAARAGEIAGARPLLRGAGRRPELLHRSAHPGDQLRLRAGRGALGAGDRRRYRHPARHRPRAGHRRRRAQDLRGSAARSGPPPRRGGAPPGHAGLGAWDGLPDDRRPRCSPPAPDTVSHTCYLAYQAMARRPRSYRTRFPVDAAPFAQGDNPVMAGLFADDARARHPARRDLARLSRGRAPRATPSIAAALHASISPRG